MTMMMARICLHETEAEECIADLKSYGFTVLSHVFPNEPEYVFLEATINVGERVPFPERVRTLLKVLGQVDTISSGTLGTQEELAGNLCDLLEQLLPMASLTDAGPVLPGHIPFQYEVPPWTGYTKSEKPRLARLALSEIEHMTEDELFEINEKYDLGIDLQLCRTTTRKRNTIIVGLMSVKMLED